MSSHFIYTSRIEEKGRSTSYAVFFFPIHQGPLTDLDDDIKDYFTNNRPVENAIFIFPSYQEAEIVDMLLKGKAPIKRLRTFLYDKQIYLLRYDEGGDLLDVKYLDGPTALRSTIIKRIKHDGLHVIFFERGGLLEGDETFHYILPSMAHSKIFIRVGNILMCSNEVYFIGMCLLPYFKANPSYVYCDSASISPVVYSTIILKQKICYDKGLTDLTIPSVDSFGGYDGMKDFNFNVDQCLVIISTSTSGNLKRALAKRQIDHSSIITLIYNGDAKGDREIVTNIATTQINEYKNKVPKSKTYESELDCEYCNKNSIPVKLSGDQFLPAKPYLDLVLVKKEHRPNWLNEFMQEFYSKEIIKCHYGKGNKIREFYLDLEKVHEEIDINFEHTKVKVLRKANYQTKFYKYLENNLPVTVVYIMYLPDPASQQMAEQIKEYLTKKGSPSIEIINFNEFIKGTKIIQHDNAGTILVVSSSIATGKKLYQLSLKFRDFENLSVSYFFGICRTPTKVVFDTLKSDLRFRRDLINDNKMDVLQNIHIPDRHTDFGKDLENSPWAQERSFITDSFRKIFVNKDYDLTYLESRVNHINEAEALSGMYQGLFWKSIVDDTELKLRKSFAFFDFDYYSDGESLVSQSEVYFTISAILHNLRNNVEDGHRLFQHEHRRSLIAPETFTRYSDGIIQACYLRGAQPGELNYSIDFNVSYNMKRTLFNIFDDPRSLDAEALFEFLYAIAIGKLRLIKRDILEFIKMIEGKYKKSEIAMAFCQYIHSIYNGR